MNNVILFDKPSSIAVFCKLPFIFYSISCNPLANTENLFDVTYKNNNI